jgi:hypothetical protein
MPLPNRSKYLAIGTFDKTATPQQLDAFMSREVPATLKLYISMARWSSSGSATMVKVSYSS